MGAGISMGLIEGNMAAEWMGDLRVELGRINRGKYEVYLRPPAWRASVDKLRGVHGWLDGRARF